MLADEILVVDEVGPHLFFLDGMKTKEYALDLESILGYKAEGPFSTRNDFHISPDKSKFLSLPMSFGKPVEGCSIAIDRGTGCIPYRSRKHINLLFLNIDEQSGCNWAIYQNT